jgi:hypothetical protein
MLFQRLILALIFKNTIVLFIIDSYNLKIKNNKKNNNGAIL